MSGTSIPPLSAVSSALLFVLCGALISGSASAQSTPAKGDHLARLGAALAWQAPRPVAAQGEDDRFREHPIRCSHLEAKGRYAGEAKLPKAIRRLARNDAGTVVNWIREELKQEPTVMALHEVKIVSCLGPARARPTDEEKAWLGSTFGRVPRSLPRPMRAHLYAHRWLRAEAVWSELFQLRKDAPGYRNPKLRRPHYGMGARSELYIFSELASYQQFCRHFFGAFGPEMSWWFFADDQLIIGALHAERIDDRTLRARFDNLVAHNLTEQYRGRRQPMPNWLPVGVGHLFEQAHPNAVPTYLLMGKANTSTHPGWAQRPKDFASAAKKLAARRKDRSLAELGRVTKLVELPPHQRAQAWSMVRHILDTGGPEKLRELLDGMERLEEFEGTLEAQARAFQETFGQPMLLWQNSWRAAAAKRRSRR